MENFKFTNEEEFFIRNKSLSYSAYITDPFRCDFCEADCTCDEEYLKERIEEIVEEFPRLIGRENEIDDYIREWSR